MYHICLKATYLMLVRGLFLLTVDDESAGADSHVPSTRLYGETFLTVHESQFSQPSL